MGFALGILHITTFLYLTFCIGKMKYHPQHRAQYIISLDIVYYEAYSKKTSLSYFMAMMELFAKIVNGLEAVNYFRKKSFRMC